MGHAFQGIQDSAQGAPIHQAAEMEGEEDFWLRTRLPVAEPEGLHGIASGNSQAATNKVGLQGFTRSASRTCFLMTRMPSRMLTPTSYSQALGRR